MDARVDETPLDVLKRIVQANSSATKDELFRMFRQNIACNPGHQRAVDWYYFVSMLPELTPQKVAAPAAAPSRAKPVTKAKVADEAVQHRTLVESFKRQIVLLDLMMPNGRAMKNCTGAEMARFGNRYKAIADRVGKSKLVGAVLNEEQVRAIIN